MKNYLIKALGVFLFTGLFCIVTFLFCFFCFFVSEHIGGGFISFIWCFVAFSLIVALFVKDID